MSNTLKEIVRLIGFHHKMTVKEIAASIGYSRVHLQKELAKGDNPNLKRLLEEKYGDLIQNVSRETSGIETKNPGHSDRDKDKIISLQDQIIAMQAKELSSLQKSLKSVLGVQQEILARLSDLQDRVPPRKPSADKVVRVKTRDAM
jgi:hypothetical protein